MVNRYDFDRYQGMVSQENYPGIGDWVDYTDYAALQASHARLLETCNVLVGLLWGREPDTTENGCYTDEPIEIQARSAIAAAQPFTET